MKKIICWILVCICLFSSSVFAASTTFKDVEGTKYEDAVEMLVAFEIINGFDDNTFKPNDSVTRAQMAKMLTIALGVTEDEVTAAKKKFLDFSDVLSSHWAYGYIKIAYDKGLINGFPNGTFEPDSTVTYAQATTMFLRALEYEDALDKNLQWPNNYMVYADEKLDLFENLSQFKSGSPASRGDIAILLWNTLRTGISKIVGQNDKGLIYGEGTPMITQYLNYIYIKDADVIDVEFDKKNKTAEVTLKEEDKSSKDIEVTVEDALEMFGRKVTVLLNKDTKEILLAEYETEYRVVTGEVSNVTTSKIYISNRTAGYNIPDEDNILLFGIDNLKEAVEVTMLVEGNNAKYCIATGASEAFVAFVADNDTEIDDDAYGITIRKPGTSRGGDEFYLANENAWPKNDSVILYYINSEDLLVVLDEVKYSDASEISALTSSSIKISGVGTFEFEDDYSVYFVGASSIKEADLDDIEKSKDAAAVATYAMHTYIFVYEDDIIDSIDPEISDLLYELEDMIEEALDFDEAEYPQAEYAKLMKKVNSAQKLNYNSSKTKIKNAIVDIEDAIEELEECEGDLTKSEAKIVKLKKELRAYINDECAEIIENQFDYTDDSYEYFEDMYYDALSVLEKTNATLEDVEYEFDYLMEAVEELEEE